jgi:cyclohexyl-isocyanide hydratase
MFSTMDNSEMLTKDRPKFRIGILLFPDVVQLDFTGCYEVFSRTPTFQVFLVSKSMEIIRTSYGMKVVPDATFDNVGKLDLICIPGGSGINALLNDDITLDFIKSVSATAKYITAVCSGSLLLGAAGLLSGRKVTTHWSAASLLREFGSTYIPERYVFDGNIITGAGVTSGIDFALAIVDKLMGRDIAAEIMLGIEYSPQPPFEGGQVSSTDRRIVEDYLKKMEDGQRSRVKCVQDAASRITSGK